MTPATITIEDLRNPDRVSGFDHVRYDPDGSAVRPYRAGWGARSGPGTSFHGPRRATAEEAAQDYLDHASGGPASAPTALKTAGHPRAARKPLTPAQQVALDILRDARATNDTVGTVYLAIEEGDRSYAKIGWTGKQPPAARLADYQAGNRRKLEIIDSFVGSKTDETALHRECIAFNELGEWFRLSPAVLSAFETSKRKASS